MQNNKITKCIIKAFYKNVEYVSNEITLVDGSEELNVINTLSNEGTNSLNQLKIPLSNNEFLIFSKKQLDETLFSIKIYDESPKYKKSKKDAL